MTALICAPIAYGAQSLPSASAICAAPGVNPRVSTHLSAPLKSPRVYFRADDTGPEYYVDLFQGVGDEYWAIMPAVDASTKSITYRIAAQDATGNWTNGTPVRVGVTPTCPANSMSGQEQVASDNIILGLTAADESAIPTGFSCKGIKSVIASNGQMRPAEDCRAALAKAGGAGAAVASGAAGGTAVAASAHGLTVAELALLGIGAAAVGYTVGHNNQNNNKPVSPSRP